MKEMVQRQKDAVFSLGIEFSIKHPLFALLVRHSEWILNHLVRNDFVVELDNRVIKTSPYGESHWKSCSDIDFTSQSYPGLIAGSDEVIALHPDGVQRHHGEWRVSQLDDPESNLRELNSAPEIMTEVDWRTPGCDITKGGTLRNAENEFFVRRYQTRCGLSFQRNDFWDTGGR